MNKKINIQKILDNQNEYFNNIETEQAPSGEWAEYNINYLVEEAKLEGIEEIIQAVGSCKECFYADKTKNKDKIECKLNCVTKDEDWYCADFIRINDD